MKAALQRGAFGLFIALALILTHFVFIDGASYDTLQLPEDIYFSYVEGHRLTQGQNPYARVLQGNMLDNEKYATYFPGFYLLSAAAQELGLREYNQWLAAWRIALEFFYAGTGLILLWAISRRAGMLWGLVALYLWLFNRWCIAVVPIAHLDPTAVFFLILSWVLYPRRPIASMLLLGASLAIKQLAVFLIPIYILAGWQQAHARTWRSYAKSTFVSSAAMLAIPIILSIPFLLWNAKGYILSIAFSATRYANNHFQANSIDQELGWRGLAARLPLLLALSAAYWLYMQKRLNRDSAALLVMSVFIFFNPVLYTQYMLWTIPFLLLALAARRSINSGQLLAENRGEVLARDCALAQDAERQG